MTNKRKPDNAESYVDISSGNQVKRAYKKKGRSMRIVSIALSVLLIIGGAVPIALYMGVGMANYSALDDISIKETVAATDGEGNISTSFTDSDLLSDPKILNIMLFGEDKHSKKSFGRSDSMMLLSVDNRSKSIKITSFQRDTYLYIPGHGYDKMTHAYPLGGPSLAIRTVEANFGIKVDRYATVDFSSFKKIIDTLGGIDMKLSDDEIEYINYQMYKNNQTSERYTIKDKAGVVHLNGQEALWYARNRGLSTNEDGNEIGLDGDDWDRTDRQRKLMDTLFKSIRNASFDKIISIASQVGPYVTTNLKKDEITGLLARCLTYLKYNMKKYNIPQEGLWSYYDAEGVSYIQINDMDKCRERFIKFIFGSSVADSFLSSSSSKTSDE